MAKKSNVINLKDLIGFSGLFRFLLLFLMSISYVLLFFKFGFIEGSMYAYVIFVMISLAFILTKNYELFILLNLTYFVLFISAFSSLKCDSLGYIEGGRVVMTDGGVRVVCEKSLI